MRLLIVLVLLGGCATKNEVAKATADVTRSLENVSLVLTATQRRVSDLESRVDELDARLEQCRCARER